MAVTTESDTVTRIRVGDREIVLLGTAHVSQDSVTEVDRVIRAEHPDRVCIEIDAGRYAALTKPHDWSRLDIFKVIKEKKAFLLLGNLVLSSFQRRLGAEFAVQPGAEMAAAAAVCAELAIPCDFADRDIQVTLRRAWAMSSFWGKNKLLAAMISSVVSSETPTAAEIEQLKQKSALESMMDELAAFLPSVKSVLIDERDRYLAASIQRAQAAKIVAVVGAGHVPGIVRYLSADAATAGSDGSDAGAPGDHGDRRDGGADDGPLSAPAIARISQVPPPGRIARVLPWVVPAAVVVLIVLGFVNNGWDGGLQSLWRWVLVNGTLSAAGTLVAFGHPLTIVAAFLAAPITSMNPTIGVGFVTGLLEALLRRPQVRDFEALQRDITSVKGFFRNRITRVLLVFALSSLGSAIGTFIAIPLLFP